MYTLHSIVNVRQHIKYYTQYIRNIITEYCVDIPLNILYKTLINVFIPHIWILLTCKWPGEKTMAKLQTFYFYTILHLFLQYLEMKMKYLPFEFSYYYDNMILQNNSNYLEQNWNMLGVSVE